MASRLPILIGALSLVGSFAVPYFIQTKAILGNHNDWIPDRQFAGLAETCKIIHPDKLLGCEKFTVIDGSMYAACITDWEIRRKWFPGLGPREDVGPPGAVQGKLWKMDLDTHEIVSLTMKNFPSNTDMSVHGMDVIKVAPNQYSIYMVNHRREGSVIEKFSHKHGDKHMTYIATFNGSANGLYNPNDVTAVPVSEEYPDSISAFYATNDHYFHTSQLGRTVELLLRLPTSAVYFHSTSTGFHKAAGGVIGANGITNNKGKLFVAAIFNGEILIYDLPKSPAAVAETGLSLVKKVQFGYMMDNLHVDSTKKWLYLTGHGQPFKVEPNWHHPDEEIAPSVAYRMSLAELEPGFFGTKGEMGEMTMERVVADSKGQISNASCTSVGDEIRKKYWITGLTTKGITECDLPSADEQQLYRNEHDEENIAEDG